MVLYKGEELAVQRLDMLVDGQLIVEIKSKSDNPDAGSAQLFNYLRSTNLEIGLLFNFGTKPSFKRVVCRNSSRRAGVCCDLGGSEEKKNDDTNNIETADETDTKKRRRG
jgi:hypothetical protein